MQMKKEESIPLHVGLVPGPFLSETEIYFNDVSKDEQIKRIVLVSKKTYRAKIPTSLEYNESTGFSKGIYPLPS